MTYVEKIKVKKKRKVLLQSIFNLSMLHHRSNQKLIFTGKKTLCALLMFY
jgi:hypothetical protein